MSNTRCGPGPTDVWYVTNEKYIELLVQQRGFGLVGEFKDDLLKEVTFHISPEG